MASPFALSLPPPLRHFFTLFPLYTHPPIDSPDKARPVTSPTLWIHPPWSPDADVLSSDVECLKWQAYLALRGLSDIDIRWDVSPDGALDNRLPNLHVPLKTLPGASEEVKQQDDGEGELLPAHLIPEWVDGRIGAFDELEGYADETARDESRAWVSLLEGNVHAALVRVLSRAARTCPDSRRKTGPPPTLYDVLPESTVALQDQAPLLGGRRPASSGPALRHQFAAPIVRDACQRRRHRAAIQRSDCLPVGAPWHRQVVPRFHVS